MNNFFDISIDRLQDNKDEKLVSVLDPDFMELDDEELSFSEPVSVEGSTYLAEDHLILQLNVQTTATLNCKICNDPVGYPISLPKLYLTVPLEEISGRIFNFKDSLRESLLLETPNFLECNEGCCPKRTHLKEFSHSQECQESSNEDVYFPFQELDKPNIGEDHGSTKK